MVKQRGYGDGTLEQRGPDKWMVRVNHGRDPSTGKRVRETRVVRGSRQAAVRVLNDMRNRKEQHGPTPVTQGRLSLDAWVKQHVAATDLSERTRAGQLDLWTRYSSPSLRATTLRDVTTAALQARVDELREHISEHTGRKLAPRTIQIWFNVVRASLADAVRLHRLSTNPARDVVVPEGTKTSKAGQALTPDEVKKFLDYDPDARLHALWHVAAYTGVRPGELLALRWEDWDRETATLHVRRALVRVGKHRYFADCKAGSERKVPVAQALKTVLLAHQLWQNGERAAINKDCEPGESRWLDESLMFTNELGGPLDQNNTATAFRARLKAAKVRKVRWYDLRHSFGSALVDAGEDIKTVAELMGHQSTHTTWAHYVHPNEAKKAAAVAKLPWSTAAKG